MWRPAQSIQKMHWTDGRTSSNQTKNEKFRLAWRDGLDEQHVSTIQQTKTALSSEPTQSVREHNELWVWRCGGRLSDTKEVSFWTSSQELKVQTLKVSQHVLLQNHSHQTTTILRTRETTSQHWCSKDRHLKGIDDTPNSKRELSRINSCSKFRLSNCSK